MKRIPGRSLSRRGFIQTLALASVGTVVAACSGSPSTPTPAASAPTAPTAPAAATSASATNPTAAPNAIPTTVGAHSASVAPASVPTAGAQQTGTLKAPEPNAKPGGTVRFAVGVTTPHFDVHQGAAAHVLCHMYNNIVRWNLADGLRTVIPDLAEKWDVSSDSLVYTFHLRQGVLFHDGTPFTSADALASLSRVIDPPKGIVSINQALLTMVDKVEAPDDQTIKITLKHPSSYFLNVLADPTMVIYSKKTLDANGGDLRKVKVAPGTGAFLFKEYLDAEKWTMVPNPKYWEPGLPYVSQMEWLHVPAWSDRGTAVLTGQADISWNVSRETWDRGATEKDKIGTSQLANFGAYVVYFNTRKKPFDDPRVRRAIRLAVSRTELIKAYQTQEAIADFTRWVPHGDKYALSPADIAKLPGYRTDKTQDIADAKKLLADAGFPDGLKGVDFLAATVAPQSEIMAPAFQDQIKRTLNIESKIRTMERSLMFQEERAGNYDIALDTTGQNVSDFSVTASLYFRTGGSQNYAHYSNPTFDKLMDQIDVELNYDKRYQMIRQAEDILDNDSPWSMVGYTHHLPMWQSYAKGLSLATRAFAQWGHVETVWLDK
ncbi:MAG TPA: ABC transporter substrate-binding protein [Chloroflexota bacterium]|nr:ABC transporter substrate-binding protein [Chloroflexota bacterium]